MSKAVKQSLGILVGLLLVSLGFAGFLLFGKQSLKKENVRLDAEIQSSQQREKKHIIKIKDLTNQVKAGAKLKEYVIAVENEQKKFKKENSSLTIALKKAEKQAEDSREKMDGLKNDRDKWKHRIDDVRQERDDLMAKVSKFSIEKSNYQDKQEKWEQDRLQWQREKSQQSAQLNQTDVKTYGKVIEIDGEAQLSASSDFTLSGNRKTPIQLERPPSDEEYWASVLRQKASLELKIENLQTRLSQKTIDLLEIRQKNDTLQGELDVLKDAKSEVVFEIKHQNDLVHNLSLELARTKNDKKFTENRVVDLNRTNKELRRNVKQLVKSKASLEKSIVRLSREKDTIEKQLGSTEHLIQSKIDEIWEIKDSIDRTFKDSQLAILSENKVELPPILVSSNRIRGDDKDMHDKGVESSGYNGKIVSVNEENNFAIVDVGEGKGIQLGDMLSVYRDTKYIASLEVIQTRKDISAADIKVQWAEIQIGDIVK